MKQPVDIAKERRKRQRTTQVKQVAALLVALLFVVVGYYVYDVLVRNNMPLYLGEIFDSVGGEGFPTELATGKIENIAHIGKNLVVLKERNLYIYNINGKLIENLQQMKERTIVQTNADRMLYYDIGGNTFTVHAASNEVFHREMKDNIMTADLGNNGEVAVVTWPPNFVAEITVYNNSNEPIYNRAFSEKLVSYVAVSPKAQQLAVATLASQDGEMNAGVLLYPLEQKAEPIALPMPDQLVVWMDYLQEDTLLVLTNKGYYVFDPTGKQLGSFLFYQDFQLIEFREHGGTMCVLGRDTKTREFIVTVLSSAAAEQGTMRFERRPLDFSVNANQVYLLASNRVLEYSHRLEKKGDYPADGVQRIYLLDDRLYLFTKEEIHILEK